jgi:hypothetical protein
MSAARRTLPIDVFPRRIAITTGGNIMNVIQLGCLRPALLVVAIILSSAVAEISPNAAEYSTGEDLALRPQGVTHDWDIPDSPLDGITPKITVSIPTEFKIDIDLTIHQADSPFGERGERLRRLKVMASRRVRHLRCPSEVNHARRHP